MGIWTNEDLNNLDGLLTIEIDGVKYVVHDFSKADELGIFKEINAIIETIKRCNHPLSREAMQIIGEYVELLIRFVGIEWHHRPHEAPIFLRRPASLEGITDWFNSAQRPEEKPTPLMLIENYLVGRVKQETAVRKDSHFGKVKNAIPNVEEVHVTLTGAIRRAMERYYGMSPPKINDMLSEPSFQRMLHDALYDDHPDFLKFHLVRTFYNHDYNVINFGQLKTTYGLFEKTVSIPRGSIDPKYLQLYDAVKVSNPEVLGPNGGFYVGLSSDSSQILLGVPKQGFEVNAIFGYGGGGDWLKFNILGWGEEIFLNSESVIELYYMIRALNKYGNPHIRNVFTIRNGAIIEIPPDGPVKAHFTTEESYKHFIEKVLELPFKESTVSGMPRETYLKKVNPVYDPVWQAQNNLILIGRGTKAGWKLDPASMEIIKEDMLALTDEQLSDVYSTVKIILGEELANKVFSIVGVPVPD